MSRRRHDQLVDPLPCADCGGSSTCVTGREIYPHRGDLHHKRFWLCGCGAYVGCHPGSTRPLGSPAGAETRRARNAAHAAFDPLWKRKIIRDGLQQHEARRAGYEWLAEQMGLPMEQTHIGMFTAAQCARVVEIIASARAAKRAENEIAATETAT